MAASSPPGADAGAGSLRAATAAALLIALVLYALTARGGALLTPQAQTHLKAAASLLAGDGLEVARGEPLARFPPLYALLLAAAGSTGADPIAAVHAINALIFAATWLALFALGRAMGLRGGVLWATAALQLALASQLYYARAARPDGAMVLGSALALLATAHYLRRARLRSVCAAALACTLAASARYMALFALLPVVFAALIRAAPDARRRWRDAAVFAALGVAPMAAWLARTWWLTGHATGIAVMQHG